MKRESLLLFASLAACDGGTQEAADGHDHKPGQAEHHEAESPDDQAAPPAKDAASAPEGAVTFALGPHKATLLPGPDSLTLTVVDATGSAVEPSGEAKVMLTGTGQEAQKLVLEADGDAWKGAAKAQGAAGYTAVVSVPVAGVTESGKATWGSVPAAKPAHDHEDGEHAHDDADDHHDDDHGHDHGDHGHDH